jgi:hypothetical protein
VVLLEVADHRLDSAAPSHVAFDLWGDATFLPAVNWYSGDAWWPRYPACRECGADVSKEA